MSVYMLAIIGGVSPVLDSEVSCTPAFELNIKIKREIFNVVIGILTAAAIQPIVRIRNGHSSCSHVHLHADETSRPAILVK